MRAASRCPQTSPITPPAAFLLVSLLLVPLAAPHPPPGGAKQRPTYIDVSAGSTGHAEAVQVMYDPALVSFDTLLDVYWHQVGTSSNRHL